MKIVYIICIILYIISFIKDKDKTLGALKSAYKMLAKILPALLGIILVMTITLYLVPLEKIVTLIGSERHEIMSIFIASLVGSIAMIPGFIAFPLSGILLNEGVSYGVLAGLTTSLMMVGVMSLPVEIKYFGKRISILRNIAGYIIAIIVSLVIAICL